MHKYSIKETGFGRFFSPFSKAISNMKPYLLNPVRRLSTHALLRATLSPSDLLPPGLEVDNVLPLANTAPPYNKHVIINTGRSDWCSQIAAEKGPNMAKELKELLGLGGDLHTVRMTDFLTSLSFCRTLCS